MRKLANTLILLCLMGMCFSLAQASNQLRSMRISSAMHPIRVVLELSNNPSYQVFTLHHPDRVVIDLRKTQLKTRLKSLSKSNRLVKKVRVSKKARQALRLVLDMRVPVKVKTFVLETKGHYNSRLVLDLTPIYAGKQKAHAIPSKKLKFKPVPISKLPSRSRDITVVIDPGHGGKDPGASGARGTHEKAVVLQISRRLATLINRQPGMHAVMTRNHDVYLSLRQRLRFARAHKADMFIAIHADAYRNRKAHGASVFALSQRGASSEAAHWLAERENKSALVSGLDLGDRGAQLRSVLIDLSQTATIDASLRLGFFILKNLDVFTRLHHGKVEQAGFVVLKSPDIPSVLVETGFLSNVTEEQHLRSPAYQQKIANAILSGVKTYFKRYPPAGTWLAHQHRISRR